MTDLKADNNFTIGVGLSSDFISTMVIWCSQLFQDTSVKEESRVGY